MKKDSFAKKLAGYAAMSSAFLAAQKECDAQIIYTDVNPDFFACNGQYGLDLNNDGIVDFNIISSSSILFTGSTGYTVYGKTRVECLGSNKVIDDSIQFPLAISLGDTISQNNNWGNHEVLFSYFKFGAYHLSHGNFYDPSIERFLGLELKVGLNRYFGWMRLVQSDIYSFCFYIKDYAFYDFPDHPIFAGQGIPNSISEINGNSILFFPNPTSDIINLQIPSELLNAEIKIFDASGRILLQQKINSSTEQIPLTNFSSGIYFFEIRKEEMVVRRKFLVE